MQDRIIPVLLVNDRRLVKTTRFTDPVYVGDPVNAIRILMEKNIPELIILDITASTHGRGPDYDLLFKMAGECTVPLTYGGGITSLESAARAFACGIEKISLHTAAYTNPSLITDLSHIYGSQSVVVSIDVAQDRKGNYYIAANRGKTKLPGDLCTFAQHVQALGCGEILLNSIDRDGTQQGYDYALVRELSSHLDIPLIACGGAGSESDLRAALAAGASAAAAGSMFLFKGKHRAVLISFPTAFTV